MDKEMKEYFDQRLLGLATRDDVEKLRQEAKANFRQLKEENKANIVEWRQDVQSALDQLKQTMDSFLQQLKEARGFGDEIGQITREIVELNGKIKEGFAEVKEVRRFGDGIGQVTKNIIELDGKIKEGFTEVKAELGSMIKFSYADLEKKINTLEARIKALEKMVFP